MRLKFWRSSHDEGTPPPVVDSSSPAPRREQVILRSDDTGRTARRLAAEPDVDTAALSTIAEEPATASAGSAPTGPATSDPTGPATSDPGPVTSDPSSAEAVLPRIRAQESRRANPSHRRNTTFPIPVGEHHSDPVLAPPPRIEDEDSVPESISEKEEPMSKIESSISDLLAIDGASGAAIVDISSGMELGSGGTPGFDLTVAAAGNSNVIRAKLATMTDLGLEEHIEDIMITLDSQYHLINVLNTTDTDGLFIYLVLDRKNANLALARHKLKRIASAVSV